MWPTEQLHVPNTVSKSQRTRTHDHVNRKESSIISKLISFQFIVQTLYVDVTHCLHGTLDFSKIKLTTTCRLSVVNCFTIVINILRFRSVQHLQELSHSVSHSRMHVCLGAFDVVVEVVSEELDV